MASEQIGILGCGEAFDTGYGNNACILFGDRVPTVLFDCGYQVPERLWALAPGLRKVDAVYLTHFHADHAMGLAPLLMRYREEERERPLVIFGPKGVESYVKKLVDLAYPGSYPRLGFPLEFHGKESGDRWAWRRLKFECAASRHTVRNLAVRVALPSGKSFFVSGDGLCTPATLALARRSDLVLQECYTAKPATMAHSSLTEIQEGVGELGAETPARILLTHFKRDEREAILERLKRLRKAEPRWAAAEPGQVIRL